MKISVVLLLTVMLMGGFTAQSQINYYMTAPEGFAAGVTGGGTPTVDNTVTVTTSAEFITAASGSKSIILVSGTLTFTSMFSTTALSNKTILGLPGARLVNNTSNSTGAGSGILYLGGGSNIIIRNLIFEGPGAYDVDGNDNLSVKGATNVWIDHCEFQDGIDDCMDITGKSDNVTVSWCKFTHLKTAISGGSGGSADHRYSNLIGGGETDYPADGGYSITWQYCWWAYGNKDRMVRGRNTDIHIISCYWSSTAATNNISLTAGSMGSVCYCENGVFAGTGKYMIMDKTGTFNGQLVNCQTGAGVALTNANITLTNSAVNLATVTAPTYTYSKIETNLVKDAVTNTSCGAGATLQVASDGVISVSNCQDFSASIINNTPEIYVVSVENRLMMIQFNEAIDANANIEIISVNGGRLISINRVIKGNDRVELNLQTLKPGIYFLKIQTGSKFTTSKFVIN